MKSTIQEWTKGNKRYGLLAGIAVTGITSFFLINRLRKSLFYLYITKMVLPNLSRRIAGKVKEVELLQYIVAHATEGTTLFTLPPSCLTAGDPDSVIAAMDEFTRTKLFMMHVGENKGPILDKAIIVSLILAAIRGKSSLEM